MSDEKPTPLSGDHPVSTPPDETGRPPFATSAPTQAQTHTPTPTWDPAAEKALVRRLDLLIFPVMILLFILNFIDRSNFAAARLRGLEADLALTDVEYQTCISILLVGYVAMQVPSNMILTAVRRPSWYLCSCVAAWGLISAATGSVRDARGAILCRFFLGCVEASFFPGSLYFLSRWYTRREMQLRVTVLNAGNMAAQAFGGLIAAGILTNMQGVMGLAAWRWLLIIEGAVTVAVAGGAVLVLPDYPQTTVWLTAEEKRIAIGRLAVDAGAEDVESEGKDDEVSALEGLRMSCRDPKVWLLGLTYHATIMGLSFSFFFPTITQALGYSTTTTLLLTAPPWIFAILVSLPNAWHADYTGERFLHYLVPALVCIVGYVISITTTATAPRYVSMFLMTTGYASGFVTLAWISNTIPRPAAKKAAAIAIVNAMGNIGSIPGSYMWPQRWGPLYVRSFGIEIAVFGFAILCALVLRFYLRAENRRLDREEGVVSPAGVAAGDTAAAPADRPRREFRYLY